MDNTKLNKTGLALLWSKIESLFVSKKYLSNALQGNVAFDIDFVTGELKYDSETCGFDINSESGNLEWRFI